MRPGAPRLDSAWRLREAGTTCHPTRSGACPAQPGISAVLALPQALWQPLHREHAASLYNLASDPGESTDVSAAHPEVVQRLRGDAEAFEKEFAVSSRPIGHAEGYDKDKAEPEAQAKKNPKRGK